MSLSEIGARLRRHVLAVLAVLIVSAGVAYSFKHTTPTYQETSTMVFLPPISGAKPNPYASAGGAITEAAGVMTVWIMSPQGQEQVRRGGGTAEIDVELVNSYNLEYPDFSNPYVTVTTTSQDFTAVHRTFTVVSQLIANQFRLRQMQYGVAANSLIGIVTAGDTGPLLSQGSSKRSLAGLVILTLLAVFAVTSFLDRHPVRLRRFPGVRMLGSGRSDAPFPGRRRPERTGPPAPDY